MMKPNHYDIVRKDGEKLLWLEDAADLVCTESRIRELTSVWPGEFQVMGEQKHRLVTEETQVPLADPERNLYEH